MTTADSCPSPWGPNWTPSIQQQLEPALLESHEILYFLTYDMSFYRKRRAAGPGVHVMWEIGYELFLPLKQR
ncbi:hypothetical protein Y1Q_0001829 [Alligator mississippiensis]|uniref:Uncharacterized protein n=1 Tax=Alligator mississippiensis TaxID=8496 RepID=A0A151MM89_ALLMI|nr:hypothetical protein Y1Q_0001829 [Alligator mississippiensis]